MVWKGLWKSRDLPVAVKKLRLSNLTAQAHADLMREVTMLRRTRMPTVVALLGIVRTEGEGGAAGAKSFMLVLEFMNLGSLWDVLRKIGTDTRAKPEPGTPGTGRERAQRSLHCPNPSFQSVHCRSVRACPSRCDSISCIKHVSVSAICMLQNHQSCIVT